MTFTAFYRRPDGSFGVAHIDAPADCEMLDDDGGDRVSSPPSCDRLAGVTEAPAASLDPSEARW